jgi:hypothetical protein
VACKVYQIRDYERPRDPVRANWILWANAFSLMCGLVYSCDIVVLPMVRFGWETKVEPPADCAS